MTNESHKLVKDVFMKLLPPKDKIQCQYIWVDGSLRNLRTKSKTWTESLRTVQDLPVMEFCGSGTVFDVGNESDYYSYPIKMYKDPFRLADNRLIFCETRTRDGLPTFANNRHRLRMIHDKTDADVNEFTFYQPYTLLRTDGKPLSHLQPAYSPDSNSGFSCGREIAESHYKACLYAGIRISCMESVSKQGQWTYGIGPRSPVDLGDDVWMSRFLLMRVAEDFGIAVNFDSVKNWSCLKSFSASLDISTEHLTKPYRQRTIDEVYSKFGVNDNPLKIVTLPNKIKLEGISSEVDPYSVLTRLLEPTKR